MREAAHSEGPSGHVSDPAKLADLKDRGALSAEEYGRAKAELLV